MQFLKGVWTFLVGVKDALVLIFMLLLFGLLWAGLSMGGPSAVSVPNGAALDIRLDGLLVDQPTELEPMALLGGQQVIPETDTLALVRAIDKAADDSSISMITLNLDSFMGGGQANLQSVGAALKRFRAKKKRVEAWATAYTDAGYYLAAHADSIGISPLGAMALSGPGGSNLYFKDALDKLKVNVEVFRVGTYKSFVEPFTRTGASPEAKAADQVLADQQIAASTPGLAFIVLVAVGADYNMLLISRIRDESPHGISSGVIKTVRATGSANGANNVAVLIPCHRVVRSDGSIGEYGGHPERKVFLQALERSAVGEVAAV